MSTTTTTPIHSKGTNLFVIPRPPTVVTLRECLQTHSRGFDQDTKSPDASSFHQCLDLYLKALMFNMAESLVVSGSSPESQRTYLNTYRAAVVYAFENSVDIDADAGAFAVTPGRLKAFADSKSLSAETLSNHSSHFRSIIGAIAALAFCEERPILQGDSTWNVAGQHTGQVLPFYDTVDSLALPTFQDFIRLFWGGATIPEIATIYSAKINIEKSQATSLARSLRSQRVETYTKDQFINALARSISVTDFKNTLVHVLNEQMQDEASQRRSLLAWTLNNVSSMTLHRGSELRQLTFSDLDVIDHVEIVQGSRKTFKVVKIALEHSKTTKLHQEYSHLLRHKDPMHCPVFALAVQVFSTYLPYVHGLNNLFQRECLLRHHIFTLDKHTEASRPRFKSTPYGGLVYVGDGISDKTHRDVVKATLLHFHDYLIRLNHPEHEEIRKQMKLWREADIAQSTHLMRAFGSTVLSDAKLSDQGLLIGRWSNGRSNTQEKAYIAKGLVPLAGMCVLAGFSDPDAYQLNRESIWANENGLLESILSIPHVDFNSNVNSQVLLPVGDSSVPVLATDPTRIIKVLRYLRQVLFEDMSHLAHVHETTAHKRVHAYLSHHLFPGRAGLLVETFYQTVGHMFNKTTDASTVSLTRALELGFHLHTDAFLRRVHPNLHALSNPLSFVLLLQHHIRSLFNHMSLERLFTIDDRLLSGEKTQWRFPGNIRPQMTALSKAGQDAYEQHVNKWDYYRMMRAQEFIVQLMKSLVTVTDYVREHPDDHEEELFRFLRHVSDSYTQHMDDLYRRIKTDLKTRYICEEHIIHAHDKYQLDSGKRARRENSDSVSPSKRSKLQSGKWSFSMPQHDKTRNVASWFENMLRDSSVTGSSINTMISKAWPDEDWVSDDLESRTWWPHYRLIFLHHNSILRLFSAKVKKDPRRRHDPSRYPEDRASLVPIMDQVFTANEDHLALYTAGFKDDILIDKLVTAYFDFYSSVTP